MGKLNFKEVTNKNFYEIVKLSNTLSEGQKKCVADNSFSIAEGSVYKNAYYRGIYLEEEPVGFFMVFIPDSESKKDPDGKDFFLWRFMIAKDHQNKRYGVETLDHIVNLAKERGFNELVTSCEMGDVSPYDFYIKYGFTDTGKVAHNEQVLVLKFE